MFTKSLALWLIVLLGGCASFGTTPAEHLAMVQQAAIASRLTIQPVIDSICRGIAERCRDEQKTEAAYYTYTADGDDFCPQLQVCDKVRTIIIATLQSLQFAITDANTALAIGDMESYEEAMKSAIALLKQVREQLTLLGVIGEGE